MYEHHPLSDRGDVGPLEVILNLLWLVLGGAVAAFGWFVAALLMVVTIIGIPWAKAAFDNGVYTLWPFGARVVSREWATGEPSGPLTFLGNVIWLALAGWWLALGHFLAAIVLGLSIIGLPFAWAHLKLAGFALWPMGREIVDANAWR